jgi:hypothetical protein
LGTFAYKNVIFPRRKLQYQTLGVPCWTPGNPGIKIKSLASRVARARHRPSVTFLLASLKGRNKSPIFRNCRQKRNKKLARESNLGSFLSFEERENLHDLKEEHMETSKAHVSKHNRRKSL